MRFCPAPTEVTSAARVAVLMCTFQGEAFLAEQLDSISNQTHRNWKVWVSDDGSTDGTLGILKAYQSCWGTERLLISRGPSAGSAANFLSLTDQPSIEADLFAWADQDDVWEPDKLARAVSCLQPLGLDTPALYGTRTLSINAAGHPLGLSPLLTRPPSFRNALVQNFAGGNTMTFNVPARKLLAQAGGAAVSVVTHDWWAYLVVAGCGGELRYDPHATVRYRQHAKNQIGATPHPLARTLRLRPLIGGQFSGWIDTNVASLMQVRHLLTTPNQSLLEAFAQSRQAALLERLTGLRQSGVHRQTMAGNMALMLAAFFRRL